MVPFTVNDLAAVAIQATIARLALGSPDRITHQHAKVAAIKMVSWLQPRSQGLVKDLCPSTMSARFQV